MDGTRGETDPIDLIRLQVVLGDERERRLDEGVGPPATRPDLEADLFAVECGAEARRQYADVIVVFSIQTEEAGLPLQRLLESAYACRRQASRLNRRLSGEGVAYGADGGVSGCT